MDQAFILELLGYLASILIAVSLMMKSILRLRVINLIGAVVFTVYGLLIGAYPVAVVNGLIIIIDLYYLVGMFNQKEYFTLLEMRPDSQYLRRFLDYYQQDIARFQPGFHYQPTGNHITVFVLRDMVPAGLLVAEERQPGEMFIRLDYVIPAYRDFKTGRWVYSSAEGLFQQRGVKRLYSLPGNPTHARYLEKMGFVRDGEEYCLHLKA